MRSNQYRPSPASIYMYYSTFTYYGLLDIEKLLKIFFWGQIGSSQEPEARECDFDAFCLDHSLGKFWRERDVILAPLFFAPFGRASLRVA